MNSRTQIGMTRHTCRLQKIDCEGEVENNIVSGMNTLEN